MHTSFILATLVALTSARPSPQKIDVASIEEYPDAVRVTPPVDVVTDVVDPAPAAPIKPLTSSDSPSKRGLAVEKRDQYGDCSPYRPGSGPVPSPDTVEAFASFPSFAAMATSAPTPDGYQVVGTNLNASMSAPSYMGLYTLDSYDTLGCASQCDQVSGCSAINMYIERDPTLNANIDNCPNPPSTTNYKCTLWGVPLSVQEAANDGQYQAAFHVVIAGSNVYNKNAPPPACDGYSGPNELGGAINVPSSSGTYLGYQYFPFSQSQDYDPQTCADACNTQTTYNSQHPAADGSYMACIFFDAYVLSKNGVPQGLYCSMYNQTWDASYGTEYGEYQGDDRYTVSRSYSYSLINPPNSSGSSIGPSSTTVMSSSLAASSVASSSVVSSTVDATTTPSSSIVSLATGPLSSSVSSSALAVSSSSASSSSVASSTTVSSTVGYSTTPSSSNASATALSTVTASTAMSSTAMSSTAISSTAISSTAMSSTAISSTAISSTAISSTTISSTAISSTAISSTATPSAIMSPTTGGSTAVSSTIASSTASSSSMMSSSATPSSTTKSSIATSSSAKSSSMSSPTSSKNPSTTFASQPCTAIPLSNPTFNQGLSTWSINNVTGSATYGVSSPASDDSFAFYTTTQTPSDATASLALSQSLSLCSGTNYTITIDYAVGNKGGGSCSIVATYPNTLASRTSTTVPMPAANVQSGGFVTTAITFQAPPAATKSGNGPMLGFTFGCTGGGVHTMYLDNVRVAVLNGNAY